MQHQLTIGFFDEHSAKQGELKIFKPLKQKQINSVLKGIPSVECRNNSLVLVKNWCLLGFVPQPNLLLTQPLKETMDLRAKKTKAVLFGWSWIDVFNLDK